MYYILSIFAGIIIAIMITVNGQLTAFYGIFMAAIIIHVIGSIFAYGVIKLTRQNLHLKKKTPLWFYLGGALGVITTLCNAYAFGKISLTSIIAIVLFGQTVTSLIIDSFGLFGMKKYSFQKYLLMGLGLAVTGMILMLDSPTKTSYAAILVSFIGGISVILSRTCNARLAEQIGMLPGSLVNHLVGLPICVVLYFLFHINTAFESFKISSSVSIYLGGVLGVVIVVLFNLLVPKVAAVPLTILSFIGQIFTSMLFDLILLHSYDTRTFFAGLLISSGICLNILLEKKFRK